MAVYVTRGFVDAKMYRQSAVLSIILLVRQTAM